MTFLDHINAKFFLAFPQTLLHLWDSIIPLALLPFSHIFKFIGTTSLLEFEFSNNFQFFLHFLFLPLFYVFFFCFVLVGVLLMDDMLLFTILLFFTLPSLQMLILGFHIVKLMKFSITWLEIQFAWFTCITRQTSFP